MAKQNTEEHNSIDHTHGYDLRVFDRIHQVNRKFRILADNICILITNTPRYSYRKSRNACHNKKQNIQPDSGFCEKGLLLEPLDGKIYSFLFHLSPQKNRSDINHSYLKTLVSYPYYFSFAAFISSSSLVSLYSGSGTHASTGQTAAH